MVFNECLRSPLVSMYRGQVYSRANLGGAVSEVPGSGFPLLEGGRGAGDLGGKWATSSD